MVYKKLNDAGVFMGLMVLMIVGLSFLHSQAKAQSVKYPNLVLIYFTLSYIFSVCCKGVNGTGISSGIALAHVWRSFMKIRSKESYLLLKNGLIRSYPSLQQHISCDVLVVGGGITGALIAYQLCKDGYNVVVIDARDIATGSTAATTSMLQYELDIPLHKLMGIAGEQVAIDTYREGVAAIGRLERIIRQNRISCGFRRRKSLYVAHSRQAEKGLYREYVFRKECDMDVKWLTSDQLMTRYGIKGYGAILSASAAGMDAYRFTHALFSLCVKKFGLRIFDHTALQNVTYGKRSQQVLTDEKKMIRTRHIVYTTGYESQEMLKEKVVDLNSTYALISEPLTGQHHLSNLLVWDTQDPYLYLRITSDGRLLAGGADEAFENPVKRDALIEKKKAFLVKKLGKLIPHLHFTVDHTWAGTFGTTKDAMPYIGAHPSFPGSFFVLGFGGNGITFSIMGMQMISHALKKKPDKFLEYFRFGR